MLGIDHISIHILNWFASISIIQYQLYISGKCQFFLKVLYVGFAVQIKNIVEGVFLQPLLLRLDAHAGCQINDANRN